MPSFTNRDILLIAESDLRLVLNKSATESLLRESGIKLFGCGLSALAGFGAAFIAIHFPDAFAPVREEWGYIFLGIAGAALSSIALGARLLLHAKANGVDDVFAEVCHYRRATAG